VHFKREGKSPEEGGIIRMKEESLIARKKTKGFSQNGVISGKKEEALRALESSREESPKGKGRLRVGRELSGDLKSLEEFHWRTKSAKDHPGNLTEEIDSQEGGQSSYWGGEKRKTRREISHVVP